MKIARNAFGKYVYSLTSYVFKGLSSFHHHTKCPFYHILPCKQFRTVLVHIICLFLLLCHLICSLFLVVSIHFIYFVYHLYYESGLSPRRTLIFCY